MPVSPETAVAPRSVSPKNRRLVGKIAVAGDDDSIANVSGAAG